MAHNQQHSPISPADTIPKWIRRPNQNLAAWILLAGMLLIAASCLYTQRIAVRRGEI